ncbi:hypothetical protein BpHYR1_051027 [Brachionus plicatilis]|uniref:Uncharacterized protein n=1 Tax=Brachionus plicatilis TaxID=10195 RepID=A0A3M7SQR1_BRAPC|nr:hypothetical protein BpHYR1_051027 [Brachionus plicatilis]
MDVFLEGLPHFLSSDSVFFLILEQNLFDYCLIRHAFVFSGLEQQLSEYTSVALLKPFADLDEDISNKTKFLFFQKKKVIIFEEQTENNDTNFNKLNFWVYT